MTADQYMSLTALASICLSPQRRLCDIAALFKPYLAAVQFVSKYKNLQLNLALFFRKKIKLYLNQHRGVKIMVLIETTIRTQNRVQEIFTTAR